MVFETLKVPTKPYIQIKNFLDKNKNGMNKNYNFCNNSHS